MRTTEKILWLLIGASIGAGIALLYAPKTGRETRKYIRRRAEDAGGQLRDTLAETRESVIDAGREVYKKGADLASGAAESAAGLFERGRKRVTS
jgi:gas vesicle protein